MRTLNLKNVIYFPSFNIIGGVETYCYEMALKFGKDYDITILYQNGDPQQMAHISKVARTIRYKPGDKVVCDVFIFGWGWDILDNVEAKKYVQTFHADYINRNLNPSPSPKITHRVGVAENTTKGIREHYEWAKDIVTIYNPYTPKKTKRVLRLVSPTRLTSEKGYDRMIKLCEALDKEEIPFLWTVYTDQPKPAPHPSMAVMDCKVEGIIDYIADADYLVQLSDTEGYSYSVVEALSVGTPVIATDFAVAGEQGIINGKTGYILPMDMSKIPVKDIYNHIPKFAPIKPNESHYERILEKGECDFNEQLKSTAKIKAKVRFMDIEANIIRNPGDVWEATRFRGEALEGKNLAEIIEG